MEISRTGILGAKFTNKTSTGEVLNFFLYSGGYFTNEKGRVSYEYPFETWSEELIEKIKNIPSKSIITVYYHEIPKIINIENRKIPTVILRADRVTNWSKSNQGGKNNEAKQISLSLEIPD